MVEIYSQLYIHLCKHKIPHSFDHCDCIVFRLYVKLLSTHGPNLAYCAIFLNKLVLNYLSRFEVQMSRMVIMISLFGRVYFYYID